VSVMFRHPFESALIVSWPPETWCDVTVLVAVSGGADSAALARGLAAVRAPGPGSLVLAHFNHRLRGNESDADEAFCRSLARQLGWACETGHATRARSATAAGTEESARDERQLFLREAAHRTGARYVVTAHTADDQAETILHRILRGTGLAGLAGIPRVRPLADGVVVIRPMLAIRRAEAVAYLESIGQAFRVDATNQDVRFTRNRIRHELLPRLAQDYNPGVVEALLRLAAQAAEAQDVIDVLVRGLEDKAIVRRSSDQVVLDCQAFAHQPRHVIRALFVNLWRDQRWPQQAMGFVEWDRLAELATISADAQRILPGQIVAERRNELLTLTKEQP
jgi:tRNA(Ile)-lysidine synthase